jgi:predicted DNA-binding ribbon-helix-helix protein
MERPAKRSVTLVGHRTSVTLETAFWDALKEISNKRSLSVNQIIREIDDARVASGGLGGAGLSSAIRVYVLDWYRR